jgi:hypothetical protein
MGSGDFSTDLSTERLQAPTAVGPADMHSPKEDAESKQRRRPPSDASSADDLLPETTNTPEHKIDSLA